MGNDSLNFKEKVISMIKSRLKEEGVRRFQLKSDLEIQGKFSKHVIDIYFEFIQINNLEKTIIKLVENRVVVKEDVWKFHTVLDDLKCFAKGIIYCNNGISDEAKEIADQAKIKIVELDFNKEIKRFAASNLKDMLPDESEIGDPFWTIMEVQDGHNSGN